MWTNDFQVPSEPITVRYFLTWWSNQSCGCCWHLGSWNQKWNIVRVARNFLTQCVKKSSIFSNLHHNHIYSNHNPNLNHNQYLKYLLFLWYSFATNYQNVYHFIIIVLCCWYIIWIIRWKAYFAAAYCIFTLSGQSLEWMNSSKLLKI